VTNRIVSLQILRFVAATMVVYHHGADLALALYGSAGILGVGHFVDIGGLGVDIFFVVSGFIITFTGPLSTPRPNGAQFFWRRWSRVAPLFYLMTLQTLITFWIRSPANVFDAGQPIHLDRIVATILFWPALGSVNVPPILSNGWTLCFEMIFYTAVSAVLIGGQIRRNLIVGSIVVPALVAMRRLSGWNGFEILANPIFLEFGLGVLLALAWRGVQGLSPLIGAAAGLAGLGAFTFLGLEPNFAVAGWDGVMTDRDVVPRVVMVGIPSALLVAGALALDRFVKGRVVEMLAHLGDASYSIYLVHGLIVLYLSVICYASHLVVPPSVLILTAVVLSVAAGEVTFRLLETPLQRAVRRSPAWVAGFTTKGVTPHSLETHHPVE
jgi:peptidoglycan/LPS O-acetylase OafA/YrhL